MTILRRALLDPIFARSCTDCGGYGYFLHRTEAIWRVDEPEPQKSVLHAVTCRACDGRGYHPAPAIAAAWGKARDLIGLSS